LTRPWAGLAVAAYPWSSALTNRDCKSNETHLPLLTSCGPWLGGLMMRKVAIGIVGAMALLASGFVWKAEARTPGLCKPPNCLTRCGHKWCCVPRGAGTVCAHECCKQYGTWHCPCPPKP